MHYALLKGVIEELSLILPHAKADKIIPCEAAGLCIRFRDKKQTHQLLLSPDRSLPRIHLLSNSPRADAHPFSFYLQVRKHVLGSRLMEISLHENDRIVEMLFERNGQRIIMIFELFGAKANLLLVDEKRAIVAVLHPETPGVKDGRVMLPGAAYEPPPFPAMQRRPLEKQELALAEVIEAANSTNLAVETWYDNLLGERKAAAARKRLRKIVAQELSRVERRMEAVNRDLKTAERSDEFRSWGELILAHMSRIEKGADQFAAETVDGSLCSVRLDPMLTASQNAERYFKKYKKTKAGTIVLHERLAATASDADFYRTMMDHLLTCSPEELERIDILLRKRGLQNRSEKSGRAGNLGGTAPYRTIGYNGWNILVGKSAAGNEYITRFLARPDDLWFHAEGMPGSHVLVQNPAKREVPDEIIRKAASLAAYYSKGKDAGRVPVAYTDAKYVKKPKGAKPGMVVLVQRRTIVAVPGP